MPPKGSSKPKTFKADGLLYLVPDVGSTPLHELQPGGFIAKLKSANPVFANEEVNRALINLAFTSLLVAQWGSTDAPPARQVQKGVRACSSVPTEVGRSQLTLWQSNKKLTDHLKPQHGEVNVKPQSQSNPLASIEPGQQKKQKGNCQPSVIIGGQSWFIPNGTRFRLDYLGLRAFTETFIIFNSARCILDFISNVLLEAFEAFVTSQYPTASSTKKQMAMERVRLPATSSSSSILLTFRREMGSADADF